MGMLGFAPLTGPAQAVSDREVLDLSETAEMLRVAPDVVRELAESHQIPARLVGNDWRFSRSALLDWLKGVLAANEEASAPPRSGSDPRQAEALEPGLPGVTARGVTAEPPRPDPPRPDPPSPDPPKEIEPQPGEGNTSAGSTTTVGERPTAPTTADIALRDQGGLLPRGA
jgi:excisionase family DNA binding protein